MKKLLTTSLLTIASIGTIALGGISFADEVNNAEPTGGMVNLDNYNPRLRTKKNVGGGVWNYSFNGTKHSSAYQHLTKKHSATAKNGDGAGRRDVRVAGVQAFSQVNSTLTGNTVWWNNDIR